MHGGMITSLTNEVTILPNAPPIFTATAKSSTLPRITKSLNSFNMKTSWMKIFGHVCSTVCKGAVNATAKQENPACPVSDVLSCHPPEVLFYIVLENRFFENPHEKLTFLGIVVDAS